MASNDEIQFDSPIIRVYKNGQVHRFFESDSFTPPTTDPNYGVSSRDATINPQTGVSVRLYLPKLNDHTPPKLPIVVYYHGGAFCIGSAFTSMIQNYLNPLVAQFNAIFASVDYRLAPEHPIPTAYNDSWEALKWVVSHKEHGPEVWLTDYGDFDRVFLAGDSAGSNIAHHMAMRAGNEHLGGDFQIEGSVLIHPYFLVTKHGGSEMEKMWNMTCRSTTGVEDYRINPTAVGAPSLSALACRRVLVCVGELDFLREGGRSYYEKLRESGWKGEVEIFEAQGEGHTFHVFKPNCEKAVIQSGKINKFINGV